MILIDIIAGARPNFMKVAPIINAIKKSQRNGGNLSIRLVHTGQHYDSKLSGSFFEQLNIPQPDINLNVGSGTQAEQTGAIMIKYEKLLIDEPSQLCVVVGDVTSTMACAISAQKMGVPVAHVEAGIRSGDWTMPEEINRMVTDSITNYFFTTSATANENLIKANVKKENIFFVGNTMIDTLLANLNRLKPPSFWNDLKLIIGEYLILTLHRPSNVDSIKKFKDLLLAVGKFSHELPIIFPVHPRTAKTIIEIQDLPENLHTIDPQPYLEFNYLVKNAKAVITDSGGVTEEATVLGVPCMTLRDSTERPETVTVGTNQLIGTDPTGLEPALNNLFEGKWKEGNIPEKWDGKTAEHSLDFREVTLRINLRTILLYWHTIRHLKAVQFYGRLIHRFWRPRVNLESSPKLSKHTDSWQKPASRLPSMVGPYEFKFLNEKGNLNRFGWDGPSREKLWRYNQHYFDDLNAHDAGERKSWHTDIIEKWIVENAPFVGTGWNPIQHLYGLLTGLNGV